MFFDDDVEEIEDGIEEEDYPPSEVDTYDDSSSGEEEEEDEEAPAPPATAPAPAPTPHVAVAALKPFTGDCRLLVRIEPTPIAYFLHLVDETFLASICEHTNRRTAALTQQPAGGAGSGDGGGGPPLHLAELKVFLGIVLHARHGLRELFDDEVSSMMPRFYRLFAKSMTKDRFVEILRRLHFSSEPTTEPTSLAALGNVIEHFNDKMASTYSPGRELCVYNSVVIWRGRAMCRERVARRLDGRHGVAVDALSLPSGLKLRLRVSPQALELHRAGTALGARVLDDLITGLLDKGHALYLDPFYCSAATARRLLARGTCCTGLLERVHRERSEDGVLVAPWTSGGRSFSYLTTEFGASPGRRTPVAVAAYLRATRRDRRDEEVVAAPGASLRLRWHKQVFLLALHALAGNACTLYRRYSGDAMSTYKFLAEVSMALLPVDFDDLSDDDDAHLDTARAAGGDHSRQL